MIARSLNALAVRLLLKLFLLTRMDKTEKHKAKMELKYDFKVQPRHITTPFNPFPHKH